MNSAILTVTRDLTVSYFIWPLYRSVANRAHFHDVLMYRDIGSDHGP